MDRRSGQDPDCTPTADGLAGRLLDTPLPHGGPVETELLRTLDDAARRIVEVASGHAAAAGVLDTGTGDLLWALLADPDGRYWLGRHGINTATLGIDVSSPNATAPPGPAATPGLKRVLMAAERLTAGGAPAGVAELVAALLAETDTRAAAILAEEQNEIRASRESRDPPVISSTMGYGMDYAQYVTFVREAAALHEAGAYHDAARAFLRLADDATLPDLDRAMMESNLAGALAAARAAEADIEAAYDRGIALEERWHRARVLEAKAVWLAEAGHRDRAVAVYQGLLQQAWARMDDRDRWSRNIAALSGT